MHQSINSPRLQQRGAAPKARAEYSPAKDVPTSPDGPRLAELSAAASVAPVECLDSANISKALSQSARARWFRFGEETFGALKQGAMAAGCIGMAVVYTNSMWISFSAHPVFSGFVTFSFLSGLFCAVNAGINAYLDLKVRVGSSEADKIISAPALEKAEALRNLPSASIADLKAAGDLYLTIVNDSYGATCTARALIGMQDCLTRMGTCPESAELWSKVGAESSPKYRGLPVQRELMDLALENACALYALLPDNEHRLELTESIGRLAYAGSKGDRILAVLTAARLHNIARELPANYAQVRVDLLETAHNLTRRTDTIRENIEAQLIEIADTYLNHPATLRRARLEIERILNRWGISRHQNP
ncbi:MAG: hypothetical protein EBZ48_02505 [Proteobacteria bacterium]|nr:hypothetical protein [Pseudomonadota bacterium]